MQFTPLSVVLRIALLLGVVALLTVSLPARAAPMTFEEFKAYTGLNSLADVEASPVGAFQGYSVNYLWTVIAAVLVFWMQAGFAMVEAGFTRRKNVVNILLKNLVDLSMGSLVFWLVGFGLMFGASNGVFGTTRFVPLSGDGSWTLAFLLFQTVFAATAATIVSGAMAERTRFVGYLIYSCVITGLLYPVFGGWAWGGLFDGGGWLEAPPGGVLDSRGLPPFIDFAGSTVVHSVGGWAALAGTLVLGPRIGKFGSRPLPVAGHSMALCSLGVFILWMGWFGFNAGSTTGVTGSGNAPFSGAGKAFAMIAVNTNLAASAGAVAAMLTVWRKTSKPDIGLTLNGALSGLVAITAPCAVVSPASAVVIGGVAGVLVVYAVSFFDSQGVDDPVGAVSVHGVCGVWGTLSAALFHHAGLSLPQLLTQVIGVCAAFLWSFGVAFLLFKIIDLTIGLRVSQAEELGGLDMGEHGSEAYPLPDVDAHRRAPGLEASPAEPDVHPSPELLT